MKSKSPIATRNLAFLLSGAIIAAATVAWISHNSNGHKNSNTSYSHAPPPVAEITEPKSSAHSKSSIAPNVNETKNKTGSIDADSFESTLDSLTPDAARSLLARIKNDTTNIDQKRWQASRIISCLCNRGYSHEAWDLIETNPGNVRMGELAAFFGNTRLKPDDLYQYLDNLTDPSDRSCALSGFINILPAERLHEFDFSRIYVSSVMEKNTISSSISLSIGALSNPDSGITNSTEIIGMLVDKSMDLARARKIDVAHLGSILEADSTHDAFYQWNLIEKVKNGLSRQEFEQLQSTIVPRMIRNNAQQCMSILLNDPYSSQSGVIISKAVDAWYRADSEGANNWINTNINSQSETTRDIICTSAARMASIDGDFATAKLWSARISNPQLRKSAETAIDISKANANH